MPPSPPLLLLLLLLLLFLLAGINVFALGQNPSDFARFELLRRPAVAAESRLEYLRELLQNDRLRQQVIAAAISLRHRPRRHAREAPGGGTYNIGPSPAMSPAPAMARASAPRVAESFAMPLSSAAYTGTGQYFVLFRLGTPERPFLLVADTGSDLTWVKCRLPGRHGDGYRRSRTEGRVFRPAASSSFHPIKCSSDLCKNQLPFALATCPRPSSPCAYSYGYFDGSTANGTFAVESATVLLSGGRRAKLKGLILGCTSSAVGSSFAASDGVLGLGYSSTSFVSRATSRFGGRFSYCLVDHLSPRNASSRLTFGPNPALGRAARQTELVLDPRLATFYGVLVEAVSVAGEVLEIPASVWDVASGGGAILDTGTSLTVLPEPAYQAVTSALDQRLRGVPRVDVAPFDYCYNWTVAPEGLSVPRLTVHFVGSARLDPPVKSYLIDVAPGVKCLGFESTASPGLAIIGNILQQDHLWEFDIRNRRLRFHRSTCEDDRRY